MPHRSMPFFVLTVFLLALAGCSAGPNGTSGDTAILPPPSVTVLDPATLPDDLTLNLTRRHHYLFVAGHVNGQPVGPMLLDTGSSLTLVDTGFANRVGLPVVGEGQTTGIAGQATFEYRQAESVAIVGVGIDHRRLAALSMNKLLAGGSSRQAIGGLVGFTAFAGQPFTLDFPESTLTIHRRDAFTPPDDAERFDLVSYRGLPAIVATLGGGQDVLLIIDTGANNAVSLPSQVASWPRILATHTAGAGRATGVGGTIPTQETWLRHIDVFGLRLAGVPVTFEPQPLGLSSPHYTVGRLGNQVLAAFVLTFDLDNRAIWIKFAPREVEAE